MDKPNRHAGLFRAVRDRLSSLGDEELLRLWVENDRGQYSDEAFEAVPSLLTERGVALPKQNDPPPMAARAPRATGSTLADPAARDFFATWVRPVLWVGVAVAVARLLGGIALLASYLDMIGSPTSLAWSDWRVWAMIGESVLMFAVPACLLAGIGAAMKGWHPARRILLAYGCAALALACLRLVFVLYARYAVPRPLSWVQDLGLFDQFLNQAGYALVLLVLLTRPGVKEMMEGQTAGFEVQPRDRR